MTTEPSHATGAESDRPGVRAEIHVAAPPAAVWSLVTDISLPIEWSPELRRVRWLDGATVPALGARFAGENHNERLGDWRTVNEIVELAAERAFSWAVIDPDGHFGGEVSDASSPMAVWRFDLTPEDGGTRLAQSMRVGTARSGLSLAIERYPDRAERIVAGRLAALRTAMEANLAGIKSRAEAVA